jgi:hypothetical protein
MSGSEHHTTKPFIEDYFEKLRKAREMDKANKKTPDQPIAEHENTIYTQRLSDGIALCLVSITTCLAAMAEHSVKIWSTSGKPPDKT